MKTIIFAVLMMFTANAHAEWTFVGGGANGDNFYIDKSRLKKTNNGYRTWESSDYGTTTKIGESSSVALVEYDCAEERSRILEMLNFKKHMGQGNAFHSTSGTTAWAYTPPNSIAESILKAVCH